MSPVPAQSFVRMSALARMSGVPAPTIKHYLREGLLPREHVKTTRNAALYDSSLVERIQRIKALQRERFLPLRVIKSVLASPFSEQDSAAAARAVEHALEAMAPNESRTRAQLLAAGLSKADLAICETTGMISATVVDGIDTFGGHDLAILRLLGSSRRAGITPEMLPTKIVGTYVHAIRELVRVESEMFTHGVVPRAGAELAAITDAAMRLSEQLVVLIRRKLLLPTLRAIVEGRSSPKPTRKPARGAKRKKEPSKGPTSVSATRRQPREVS